MNTPQMATASGARKRALREVDAARPSKPYRSMHALNAPAIPGGSTREPARFRRSGCMMEAATLGGIQQKMIETLGELVQVLPSSHMPVEA